MTGEVKKPAGNQEQSKKPKTMDDLRKPGLENLPETEDEFHIVSPGSHAPDGQNTHE